MANGIERCVRRGKEWTEPGAQCVLPTSAEEKHIFYGHELPPFGVQKYSEAIMFFKKWENVIAFKSIFGRNDGMGIQLDRYWTKVLKLPDPEAVSSIEEDTQQRSRRVPVIAGDLVRNLTPTSPMNGFTISSRFTR